MTTTDREIKLLSSEVSSSARINCSGCEGIGYTVYNDSAADVFHKQGWRVIKGKVKCPDCTDKHNYKSELLRGHYGC